MRITRLYTGADGESHFEDIDIPMESMDSDESRSSTTKATGIIFRETSGKFNLDWHNAPRRQYVITLKGQAEVIVGDGTRRRFSPGDVMLAEDISGRGHITRSVNNQPRASIFVTID